MRGDEVDEFTRRHDFRLFPEPGEVLEVTGYQVIRTGSIGTFQKDIIVGIACDLQPARGNHCVATVPDHLQQLPLQAFANLQLAASENITIFLQDRRRNIETGRLGQGNQEHRSLQSCRFDCSGDENVSIDDKVQRKH